MRFLCNTFLSVAFSALAVSCGGEKVSVEPGVSHELAESRKSVISDVRYDIEFHIPSSLDERVRGKETIELSMSRREDIVLDFTSSDFDSLHVNGRPVKAVYSKEHIIVPSSAVAEGHNEISLVFSSDDRFLNRNAEYLYTLFVPAHARSVFPCFDQPDMKAKFRLALNVPEGWKAMSNTEPVSSSSTRYEFGRTELLPTYLFSFVAGKWQTYTAKAGSREVTAFFRETDPEKIAQLPDIFKEIETAVSYMEEYTGVELPFEKYDFVIVPSFQFGGMEHPGAVLYNENTMFLGKNPTPDEREKRVNLIAHETAHFWFGDMVTMKWFNDVWTKEVYANYFAAEIAEPMFPGINHALAWMKDYYSAALSEDRTEGTTPVRRNLDNLADAGLIYSNIIYDKAPVAMKKLVEFMGADNFRKGIRGYLGKYAYGNATWDDLIAVLDECSEKDVKAFSDAWIYEKGMPEIYLEADGDSLTLRQSDKYGRGVRWPQTLLIASDDGSDSVRAELGGADSIRTFSFRYRNYFLPDADGSAYGLFVLPDAVTESLLGNLGKLGDTAREAALLTVYENYMQGHFNSSGFYVKALLDQLSMEDNPQIASTIIAELTMPMRDVGAEERTEAEKRIIGMIESHPLRPVRKLLLNWLSANSTSSRAAAYLYGIWSEESEPSLGDDGYINLSFQLAVRMPEKAHEILSAQRRRIDGSEPARNFNADRLGRFDFVSRAAVPEQESLDSLFNSLLLPENRTVEPWAEAALALLNHFLRDESSVKYIEPGLDALEEVKATGDIFFPSAWCRALLSSHGCPEAYAALLSFLDSRHDYPALLMDKIRVNSYNLERKNTVVKK